MIHAAAPHFLWPFVVWYAAHELNLWPCVSLTETSPTLRWTRKVGDESVFRVWDSRAFVRDTSADKLSARAIPCVFLGLVPDAPGWHFYHPTSRRVLPSQDVTFDELVPFYCLFPYRSAPSPPPPLFLAPGPPPVDPHPPHGPAPSGVSQVDPLPGTALVQGAGSGDAEPEGVEPGGAESEGAEPGGAESKGAESGGAEPRGAPSSGGPAGASPRLSSQQQREWLVQRPHCRTSPLPVPSPYTEQSGGLTEHREPASRPVSPVCIALLAPCSRPPPVPGTHTMALRPSSAPLRVPMPTPPESSLLESVSASPPSVGGECALGTDVLEDRQEDFEVKRPPVSQPAFKARYVARGFSQRQGVDYFQTFSPTPKMTTLRVLLHVAAQRDYELHSLDFSTAFLQGSLHEKIWLRRPPGFTGSFPAGTQWRLRRPVYGLRQAPREWHDTLRTTLAALGFFPSTTDSSLFLRTDTSLLPFYVLVYVDDLVFATADTEALTLVKSELQKRHTCTDLGEQRSYLGLQITRDRARHTITLTQSHMVHQVLQRFGFQYSSPQLTPLSTSHSLSAPPSDESVEPSGPYPELVGCLMHRNVHCDAAKRVLRYLCSTSGMGLMLGGRGPVVLTGHAEASWVDDSAMQRSSQGYTFSLGSGSASWRSTRSSSVLSSSCEAEIYAGAMAAQELCWLTYLLTDLGEQPRSPPVLYVDNKAMIALCLEHKLEHRTKHIALLYFLARELKQHGQLRLAYVATWANTGDVFTKALPPSDHQRFVTVLGLLPALPHLLTA
ncbi:unnamed protein product [Closterium sp. NIES-53]